MKKTPESSITPKCQVSWFIIFTMFAFVFLVSPAKAQQIRIGSGVHFVNGTQVNVKGDGILNQGTLKNNAAGVIKLTGNWQNDGTITAVSGSTVSLNGSSAQGISGANPSAFSNLTLNNAAGVTLSNNINISGSLDFQAGILATGSGTATIGASGSIANAGSSMYVSGKLAQTFAATGTKAFPIGKGGNYRPVTFQYTGLTGTSVVTAEQTESAMSGTLPANTSLLTTLRYWTISQTGGSNLQYLVTLDATGYTPSNPVVLLKKDAGIVSSYPTTSPNYTNYYALVTMSDFALGMNTCVPSFVCTNTVAELQATGATDAVFKWYADALGGSSLPSSTLLENQHKYYASQTVSGCESVGRFEVTVTLDPTPCAPSATSPQSVSAGATVANLAATGGSGSTINWFTTLIGGVALPSYMVLAAGTYYAGQTISCTESANRKAVAVTLIY